MSKMFLALKIAVLTTLICMISGSKNNSSQQHYIQKYIPKIPAKSIGELDICDDCKCGVQDSLDRKSTDGSPTIPGDHPWLVALAANNSKDVFCSGTLLNDYYVLTAAHCVKNDADDNSTWVLDKVTVLLGIHKHQTDTEPLKRKILRVIVHPEFDLKFSFHDIALLRVADWIPYRKFIKTACLPPVGGRYATKTAKVIGWGPLEIEDVIFGDEEESESQSSLILRYAEANIINTDECLKDEDVQRTGNMICTGKTHEACQKKDAGSPLVIENSFNRTMVIGIALFGKGCSVYHPGVFTRVDKYLGWISDNTEDGCYCE